MNFRTAALALLLSSAAHADTLIDHIDGLTTTPFGQVIHFKAILIGDDGKVVRTFEAGELITIRPKYHVDGKARTLVPGLIKVSPDIIGDGLRTLAARNGVSGALPKPSPRDRDFAFDAAQSALLNQGVTTVVSMGTSIEDWLLFRRAGDEARLRTRVLAFADGVAPMTAVGAGRVTPWLYEGHLRMAGVQIDGRIPSGKLPQTLRNDETRLRNQLSLAAFDGFAVALLTRDGAEVARAEKAVAELKQTYPDERLWRYVTHPVDEAQAANSHTSALEALVKATHDLAFRLGIDGQYGDLAPGKTADFSLWDKGQAPGDGSEASETWIGGAKVYERADAKR